MLIACSPQTLMHRPHRMHSIELGSFEGSTSIGQPALKDFPEYPFDIFYLERF